MHISAVAHNSKFCGLYRFVPNSNGTIPAARANNAAVGIHQKNITGMTIQCTDALTGDGIPLFDGCIITAQ